MSTRTEATEGQAKIRQALNALEDVQATEGYERSPELCYAESCQQNVAQAVVDLKAILDAPPPIVGELTEEEIKRIAEHESEFAQHFADGLRYARDHGYLAQAPQFSPTPGVKPDGIMNEGYIEATRAHGSPAPSVIEAGDAMENMMRRLRTQRDDEGILPTGNDFNGMDGLCAAWVAAKASRPSVTASVIAWHKAGEFPPAQIPDGHILIGYSNRVGKDEDYSLRQLACYPDKGPWTDWYGAVPNPDRWAIIPMPDKDIARWHMPKRATPQGVTVDDDWIDEVAHKWAVSQWTDREDMQDQRMTEFGHAVRILRFALLTK